MALGPPRGVLANHRAPRVRPVADTGLDTVLDRDVIEGLIADLAIRNPNIFAGGFGASRRNLSSLNPEARLEVMGAALDILHNKEQCTLKVKDLEDLKRQLEIILRLLIEDFQTLLSQLSTPIAWPDGTTRPVLDERLATIAHNAVLGGLGLETHGGDAVATPAAPVSDPLPAVPGGIGVVPGLGSVTVSPGAPGVLGAGLGTGLPGGPGFPSGHGLPPGSLADGSLYGLGGHGFVPNEVAAAIALASQEGVIPQDVPSRFGNLAGNIGNIQEDLRKVEEQLAICKDFEEQKNNEKKNKNKNKNDKDKNPGAKKAKSPGSASPPPSPPSAGGGQPPQPSEIPEMFEEFPDFSEWIASISAGSDELLKQLLANPRQRSELFQLLLKLQRQGVEPKSPKFNEELLAFILRPYPVGPLVPIGGPRPPPPPPNPGRSFALRIQSLGSSFQSRYRQAGPLLGGRVPGPDQVATVPGNAGPTPLNAPTGTGRTTFNPGSRSIRPDPGLRGLFPSRRSGDGGD